MPDRKKSPAARKRLSRDQWLAHALNHLAREGEAKLTIDRVVKALGVTKGSFYWHFKDRDDFLRKVVDYWDEHFTECVAIHVQSLDDSPAKRLWAIAETVWREDLARYDLAVRAWAAQDEAIAQLVLRIDKRRLGVVRELFAALGFRGTDLEMRARCFVTYISLDKAIFIKQTKKQRLACMELFQSVMTKHQQP